MADESGKAPSAADIDLDNIEVDILVICKNQNALNQSSSFLNRRGWPTTIVTDLNRAVEQIAEKRPDFVLLSLSHPNPAVSRLPDLITQTFNIHCIGFVELNDAVSAARLTQARMRYKIPGSISGPAVHRTIRRILAERFQIESAEEQVSFEAKATDGGIIIQKSGKGHAGNLGTQVIRGEGSGDKEAAGVKEAAVLIEMDQAEVDALLSETPVVSAAKKPRRSLKEIEGEKSHEADGDMLFGQTVEKGRKQHVTRMPTEDLIAEVKKSLFGENSPEITAMVPARTPEPVEREAKPKGTQSLIERAVEGAMLRVCLSIDDSPPLPLEEIGMVGVCPVDGPTQSGYIVIVWQAPEVIVREEFLRSCEREMHNAFSAMGVQGRLEAGFWIQLPGVQFREWAESHAKFSFFSVHQKREVGVAFFETEGPLAKPSPPAAEHGMYSLKVEKISTEFPVTFKAFIHFVNNNKFFLYLRNGRVLQPEQKSRLQEHQMNDFYLKGVEIENVRQYIAISFLGGLINRLKKAA